MSYPPLIERLIEHLSRLPGIGRRSAERMVYWFLDQPREEAEGLAKAITDLKEGLHFCRKCNHLSEKDLCSVCSDAGRDHKTICVVEDPKDVIAIEKSGAYQGTYHVLLGSISPGEGRGPEDLKINQLLDRIRQDSITEVVIATDPDNEGEMTSLYLTKLIKPLGITISRIGLGLPVGGSLEFADLSTLSMSLNARREITE